MKLSYKKEERTFLKSRCLTSPSRRTHASSPMRKKRHPTTRQAGKQHTHTRTFSRGQEVCVTERQLWKLEHTRSEVSRKLHDHQISQDSSTSRDPKEKLDGSLLCTRLSPQRLDANFRGVPNTARGASTSASGSFRSAPSFESSATVPNRFSLSLFFSFFRFLYF